MSTTFHTAITTGAAANAATVNAPLGQLDAALVTLDAAVDGLLGGASLSVQQLKDWAAGECYEATAVIFDSDGVPTTATVKWPDGSAGTWTITPTTGKNTTWLAVDGYSITHTGSGKTVTQPTVTRDGNGAVTVKPALTVA
jgi:hypothetical protein